MADQEADNLPLFEEDMSVTKRQIETGRVRVRTVLHEDIVDAHAELTAETVSVERVAIDREITEVPPVREEGDTLIVPVVEERLVVETRLVLREELRLTRRRTVEPVTAPVRLRRMEAVVERTDQTHDEESL